ncbi:MAG: hypothetical protein WCJ66_16915 [Verrucomicrobiota bacterium]
MITYLQTDLFAPQPTGAPVTAPKMPATTSAPQPAPPLPKGPDMPPKSTTGDLATLVVDGVKNLTHISE